MKVGIITFHRAINFGAALQVLALQKTIENIGACVEVIDYRCEYIEKDYRNIRINKNNILKDIVNNVISYSIRKNKKNKFYDFNKKYLKLSNEIYYTKKDLEKANSEYDIFITGSDQVWDNKCAKFDSTYFLDFVDNKLKKNSYAASFAFAEIPNDLKDEYKRRLKDFNSISVREESGKKIFEELLMKDISVSLDPTLLLNKEEWDLFIPKKYNTEKYILIYTVNPPKNLYTYAKAISKKTGYKIINISDSFKKRGNTTYARGIDPGEFLALFKNAEIILTNSFHGTVFSIIFEKKFNVELTFSNNKINHRSENLLKLLSLENRIFENVDEKDWEKEISYCNVKKILNCKRNESIEYLKKLLN